MREWPLWTLRRPALAYWILVDAAALAASVLAIVATERPTPDEIARFSAIAGTAGAVIIVSSVYSDRVGEIARNPWAAHLSYLTAGLVALPGNLLVLLLFGPALHGLLDQRPEVHRWLFTLSSTALAVFGTRLAIGWEHPTTGRLDVLVLGATMLLTVRAALISLGLKLRSPRAPSEEVVGEPIDVVLGVVAVSIGGLMGFAALATAVHAVVAGPPLALLERAAQLPHWRRSAQRDAKTGLANAAHWDGRARYELAKARATERPMAVLLLDLDHFKKVNDLVGHLAGDAALSAVAGLLNTSTRRGDLVGRFGGEEFVVLLPDAEPAVARSVAQRVRHAIADLQVPTVRTDGHAHLLTGLTVSIGVSTTQRFGYELPDLMVAADSALLAAKSCGRNLVEMA
ncbi:MULTISPECIES: GGDEF domain-containing protein [Actinosynnema]|uniref:GGDEF domain-containing protein n=1 Tax=Actinosynnema pretiosum TaxID=42197 RepID=A0A290ZFU0_9PSEU|nr:diguanylate cyclase [Actinosynnema pretiosum]ATE57855.1 GGDEF domain-containing protein [Actinosynnema pretiosum]